MLEFKNYLTFKFPALEDSSTEGVELVDGLRAAICDNIIHYMEKEEDLFKKYLSGFVDAVWSLLVVASASSSRDSLTVTSIKFLTTKWREVIDTRRRIACELLKGIASQYKEKVSEMVSNLLQACLTSFAQNPATNWKHKECTIYLVVSPQKRPEESDLKTYCNDRFPYVRFLNSDSNVVHSYASSCVEKLLLVKDGGAKTRYTSVDIGPYLLELMRNLFNALEQQESEENQMVCENPKNPVFNHYLFEAADVLLVELNNSPIPPHYMQIFNILLLPDSWNKPENVPALVRLLQSFLQKAPYEVNGEGRLNQVPEICKKLVTAPRSHKEGFYVLNTIIENLGYDVIAPYMGYIWTCLFFRLENNRTAKFTKSFVIFMSLFLVKHGPQNLVASVDAVQTGFGVRCWAALLVTLLSRPQQDRVGETVGYNATFVHLYNAGNKEDDLSKDIKDP
ncbi:hypothetical protein AgCh_012966 [Apium graveolens]